MYSEAAIRRARDNVQKLITTDLVGLPPFEFSLFVRGELFVLIDSLLTSYFYRKALKEYVVSDMKLILNLCDDYVKLYCKWLYLLPRFYHSVSSLFRLTATPSITIRSSRPGSTSSRPQRQ